MKRKACLLLTLALVGPGCLSSGSKVAKESKQQPPVQMTFTPPPPPPAPPAVTVDQVTESNAADIVQAMRREMDYDATVRPPAAAPTRMVMPNTANTVSP
jgi:hypothetical protein